MAEVKLEGVEKIYGRGTHVLHALDLHVHDGEFLVLVGPSGCGKSTILRIVAGLEDVSGGRVWIGGRDVTALEPRNRDIAMVFQNYALYPHLSAYDNMAFGLRMRKQPREEIDRRVRQAAQMLGIEPLLTKPPRALSGGERQRVALGRAIVRNPQVFLFDEPLSNLDAKLRAEMRAEITALHRRLGVTTIYVTHDQVEAMTMGQRIVVLSRGVVQQIGAPLEVYHRPANRFVAGFIGNPSMNLFADARREGDELVLFGRRIAATSSVPSGRFLLGVRPEDVRIATDGPFQMRVTLLEPTGGESYVYGRVTSAGSGDVAESDVIVRAAGEVVARVGDELTFRFDPERAHYFDPESLVRLEAS